MSPAPAVLHRHGFAPLIEDDLPDSLKTAVLDARHRASSLLDLLPARRQKILIDKKLSAHGQDVDLRASLRLVETEIVNIFFAARYEPRRERDDAVAAISAALFTDVDKPHLISQAHAELLAFAPRDLRLPELAHDTDGRALLGTGGPFHKLLAATVERAPLPAAALAALAVRRSSPFLQTLLGGEPVVAAVLRAVEMRGADEDSGVKALVGRRDAADDVLAGLRGDEGTALMAAAKLHGLPREALTRPDPLKAAASA